jgi:hypothetical protein
MLWVSVMFSMEKSSYREPASSSDAQEIIAILWSPRVSQKILKGSDDGLLVFLDFSIVWYPRDYKTRRFGNWICFSPQVRGGEDTYSVGPLRKN